MAGVEFLKYTPGKTARVKIHAPTKVRGQHFDEGQVVELPESEALELVIARKAVRIADVKSK